VALHHYFLDYAEEREIMIRMKLVSRLFSVHVLSSFISIEPMPIV
jgi:hypothetical protein